MSTITDPTPYQVKQGLIDAVAPYACCMAPGWTKWSSAQLQAFKADVYTWRKIATRTTDGGRVSLDALQAAATALLSHHGKTLGEVAP